MKKEQKYFDFNKWKSEKNIPIRKIKIFQLEKGKYSKQIKEIFTIRKYSCQKKKRKCFKLEKGKYSNYKNKNIPIKKRKTL